MLLGIDTKKIIINRNLEHFIFSLGTFIDFNGTKGLC
jgi:hypothetical protein